MDKPRPKFWDEEPSRPKPFGLEDLETTRSRSDKQETRIAKDENAFKVPGSGSFAGHKSDVSGERFRYEAKTTKHQSRAVSLDELIKIDVEARRHGQLPVMVISFENIPPHIERDFYIVPRSVWQELTNEDVK